MTVDSSNTVYTDLSGTGSLFYEMTVDGHKIPSGLPLSASYTLSSENVNLSCGGYRSFEIDFNDYMLGTFNGTVSLDSTSLFYEGAVPLTSVFLETDGFEYQENINSFSVSVGENVKSYISTLEVSSFELINLSLPMVDFFVPTQAKLITQTWEYMHGIRSSVPENYDNGKLYCSYMEALGKYWLFEDDYSNNSYKPMSAYSYVMKYEGDLRQHTSSSYGDYCYFTFLFKYPDDWFDVEATEINTDVTNIVFGG